METTSRLPWSQRLSYGVGHVFNDLTASMWFSYLIVYLQLVLDFDSNLAGVVLLIGQVADAAATPFLGYETDNGAEGSVCRKYGKRKSLHLIGTFCVLVSFPFIFIECPGCGSASEASVAVLLIPLVVIFQFGWAASQVAHLSLIPVITPHEAERDCLNVIRYAFDVISDVTVYVVVWVVFDVTRTGAADDRKVSAEDAGKFMLIVLIVTGIGIIFSVVFHVGVKEVNNVAPSVNNKESSSSSEEEEMTSNRSLLWKEWLKERHFYQGGTTISTTKAWVCFSADTASDALLGYECINERSLTAKFQTSVKDLNVICCYAPTEDADEDEKDRFYEQLQDILNSAKKGDITLVLGDFNAKVGTDSDLWGGVIGPFGIGSCNGNGQRLLQVGLLYMGTRLFQNVNAVFIPLYLQESLGAHEDFIAKIPLVMNVSGFVASCFIPYVYRIIGKKMTFLVGAALGMGGCAWIAVGEGFPFCARGIYGVATLLGAASSILVVCSLSFIHDLIGTSVESGAFVYGSMSFCDKMANGFAVLLVQHFHSVVCVDCDWYYKHVLAYGVGGIAILSTLLLLTLFPLKLGQRSIFQKHLIPSYDNLFAEKPTFSNVCCIPVSEDEERQSLLNPKTEKVDN